MWRPWPCRCCLRGKPAVEALVAPGPASNAPLMGIDGRGCGHTLYLKTVYESLALDPFGNPAVANRDDSTGDARLTYVPAEVRGTVYAPVIRR